MAQAEITEYTLSAEDRSLGYPPPSVTIRPGGADSWTIVGKEAGDTFRATGFKSAAIAQPAAAELLEHLIEMRTLANQLRDEGAAVSKWLFELSDKNRETLYRDQSQSVSSPAIPWVQTSR